MNILEYYKQKKSWDETLYLGTIYKSKTTGYADIRLANVCSQEPTLTLDPGIGFKEIGTHSLDECLSPNYLYLKTDQVRLTNITPLEFSRELVVRLKNYIKSNWDPSKKHIQFHSGGLDSRILSFIMRDLREEMGKDWIGDIHFRNHKPEEKFFNEVMKDQGWDKSQYSVYRPDDPFDAEYFNWYDFSFDANGYYDNGILFWDDLLPYGGFHEDVTILTGWCGGEIFNYPIWQGAPSNIFNFIVYAILFPNVRVSTFYNYFGNVLAPYISYTALDWICKMPSEFYKSYPGMDGYHDLIRITILKDIFKDTRDFNVGHVYKFDVKQPRRDYIKEKYHTSKFFNDFKHLDFVANADPWELRGFLTQEAKLYGYSTMYQNVVR